MIGLSILSGSHLDLVPGDDQAAARGGCRGARDRGRDHPRGRPGLPFGRRGLPGLHPQGLPARRDHVRHRRSRPRRRSGRHPARPMRRRMVDRRLVLSIAAAIVALATGVLAVVISQPALGVVAGAAGVVAGAAGAALAAQLQHTEVRLAQHDQRRAAPAPRARCGGRDPRGRGEPARRGRRGARRERRRSRLRPDDRSLRRAVLRGARAAAGCRGAALAATDLGRDLRDRRAARLRRRHPRPGARCRRRRRAPHAARERQCVPAGRAHDRRDPRGHLGDRCRVGGRTGAGHAARLARSATRSRSRRVSRATRRTRWARPSSSRRPARRSTRPVGVAPTASRPPPKPDPLFSSPPRCTLPAARPPPRCARGCFVRFRVPFICTGRDTKPTRSSVAIRSSAPNATHETKQALTRRDPSSAPNATHETKQALTWHDPFICTERETEKSTSACSGVAGR